MNRKNFIFLFAPIGVAFGITVFIYLSIFISKAIGVPKVFDVIPSVPGYLYTIIGTTLLILFLPIFILGIIYLNRRGAVGQSETLRVNGIYKYTRNPMYIGISMTIIGIGLLLRNTGVIIGGIVWFCITYIQCKREEPELTNRFGNEYLEYKKRTPMFIPKLKLIIKNAFSKKVK
jgi:protein-S-isoprenylcysteine O-methyltransferase Ste14